MSLLQNVKDYFALNHQDKIFSIVAISISVFFLIIPNFYENIFLEEEPIAETEAMVAYKNYINEQDSIELVAKENGERFKQTNFNTKNQKKENSESYVSVNEQVTKVETATSKNLINEKIAVEKSPAIKLEPFDPNAFTEKEWRAIGLGKFATNNLIKFKNKGAVFYAKEDLLKVYGFEEAFYNKIEPYLIFPKKKIAKTETKNELKPFDPNTFTQEQWLEIGLSKFATSNLVKFKNKGAIFYTKEDLLKVYGFEEAFYNKIESFLLFPKQQKNDSAEKLASDDRATEQTNNSIIANDSKLETYIKKDSNIKIEVNSATKEDFQKLKGLGPKLSERIIKFRNGLGGFYSIDQIAEVFGIEQTVFDNFKNQLTVDDSKIVKQNLNTVSQADLESHVYINNGIAKHIVKFRKKKKRFKQIEDLRESYLIDEELYRKLAPYFFVE